jgi:hypothetical protein
MSDVDVRSTYTVKSTFIPYDIYALLLLILLGHTTYRKNNNHEKCEGIGLNGFIFKQINKKYCINEKKDPGSRLGFAC